MMIIMGDQIIVYMFFLGDELEEVYILIEDEEVNCIMIIVFMKRRFNYFNGKVSYKYIGYSKFLFILNFDVFVNIFDMVMDMSLVKMKYFFDIQYLFLMESILDCYFDLLYCEKEEIIVYKIFGFKDFIFFIFVSELQIFYFYEN